MILLNDYLLNHATHLAQTAAQVAHEAQPYPQDSDVFKGLADLSNAMSAASLRLLAEAVPAEAQADSAPTVEVPAAKASKAKGAVLAPADDA